MAHGGCECVPQETGAHSVLGFTDPGAGATAGGLWKELNADTAPHGQLTYTSSL